MNVDACADQEGEGDRGSGPPEKNHKNIGFLSKTGPDPLKNHKATKPVFIFGPSSAASETQFKWRFAGGPMNVRLPSITYQLKNKLCQGWTLS